MPQRMNDDNNRTTNTYNCGVKGYRTKLLSEGGQKNVIKIMPVCAQIINIQSLFYSKNGKSRWQELR